MRLRIQPDRVRLRFAGSPTAMADYSEKPPSPDSFSKERDKEGRDVTVTDRPADKQGFVRSLSPASSDALMLAV